MHLQPRYQDDQQRLASIMGYEGGERTRRGEEGRRGMKMLPRKDENEEGIIKNHSRLLVVITDSGLLPECVS